MNARVICTVVAALLAAGCLFAQSSQVVVVKVPFGFQAARVNLPAGEITIDRVCDGVIRVSSSDRKHNVMTITMATSNPRAKGPGKLVFHRYGDKYFLTEVWPTADSGRALPPSLAEKEMLQAGARPAQHVLLLARTAN